MSFTTFPTQNVAVMLLAILVTATLSHSSHAQDFRVDTDVRLGKAEETFSEHLTLFHGSIVYDFTVKGHQEITILDQANGTISLLDVVRRKRANLTTAELLDFSAKIKSIGTNNQAEDLVAPKFDVSFDDASGVLLLQSPKITYRATGTELADSSIAQRYREFTDWYARLNSMRPPNPPHFARLELNRELATRGLMPTEIERTVSLGRLFEKPQTAKSNHVIGMAISGTDRRRIDEAGGYLVSFTEVTLADYMQVNRVATK